MIAQYFTENESNLYFWKYHSDFGNGTCQMIWHMVQKSEHYLKQKVMVTVCFIVVKTLWLIQFWTMSYSTIKLLSPWNSTQY